MADVGEEVVEKPDDLGTDDAAIADRWIRELQAARKGPYNRWVARAKKAIKRYRDEEATSGEDTVGRRNAQFNVLWSNMGIQLPAIYARPPTPIVERRYLDKDIVARAASTILQRALTYQIEVSDLHEAMRQCRIDYGLTAFCSAWARYSPTYEQAAAVPLMQEEPGAKPGALPQVHVADEGYSNVASEKICIDYCHWGDDLVSPARFWSEVTWRARRARFTRKQLVKLSKAHGAKVPLSQSGLGKKERVTDGQKETFGKAEVWQIWDFIDKRTIWICEAYPEAPLKQADDLLELHCFAPAARPARSTTTNDTVWPIPDYEMYFDQARELDTLTARIAALTRAIKAVGVFDNSIPELERLMNDGMENKLVGTKNWAKFTQKGGLAGAISFMPIKEFADALTALHAARTVVKQDLYEISGTSDIMRGATNPNETASAQKLKGQFGSARIADRRDEFNRFVRDTLLIMAEIICEWFSDETIWLMSDFEQWAKDQDLRSWASERFPMPPGMGHNGGPPLDMQQGPGAMMGGQALPGLQTPSAPAQPPDAFVGPVAGQPQAQMAPPVPGIPLDQPPPNGAMMPPPPGAGATPIPGGQRGPAPIAQAPAPPSPDAPGIPPKQAARELFNEALKLLRDDKLRSFRIDVETDSTIQPDIEQEKQLSVEFVTSVTQFIAQAGEMTVSYPQMVPVLGKLLLFAVRRFRVGRDLESSLENLVAESEKQARNPAPPPPSPEEVKAKAAAEQLQQKGQLEREKMQGQMQMAQQQHQLDMQKLQMEMQALQQKLQMELQKLQAQLEAQQQKAQLQAQADQQKLAMQQEQGNMQLQQDEQRMALEGEQMERQAEHDERQMERTEQHDERKNELAIQAAKQKAAAAPKSGAANGGRAR